MSKECYQQSGVRSRPAHDDGCASHHKGLQGRTQVPETGCAASPTVSVSSVKFPPTATVFSPDRDRVFPRPRPCFPPTATVLGRRKALSDCVSKGIEMNQK